MASSTSCFVEKITSARYISNVIENTKVPVRMAVVVVACTTPLARASRSLPAISRI